MNYNILKKHIKYSKRSIATIWYSSCIIIHLKQKEGQNNLKNTNFFELMAAYIRRPNLLFSEIEGLEKVLEFKTVGDN